MKYNIPKLKHNTLPNYLNWAYFEENLLVTKNSLLISFFKLVPHGNYYSTEEDEKIANMWNNFQMILPDGITYWYEYNKYLPDYNQYESHIDDFSGFADREIERIRTNEFSEKKHNYISSRILSIAFSPSITKTGLSEQSINSFKKIIQDIISRFATVNIDVLQLSQDEICTYLHSMISTKKYPIKTPSASNYTLSDILWDDYIDPTMIPLKLGNKYISIISIDDFPTFTFAEMLSKITAIDGTLRWVTRYQVKSSTEAKKLIDSKRRTYFSRRFSSKDVVAASVFNSTIDLMDTSEITKYQECELALGENGSSISFGYYSGLFIFEAETEKELAKIGDEIQSTLGKFGFIYRLESLNTFSAWLSSLPGNIESNPRRQFISTGNVACLLSFTAPYQGEEKNLLMQEICGSSSPHAIGVLPNKALYRLNLNGRGNSGHTFIVGPTGGGKSILLSFLAASWGKYPDSRVIIFDKGASSLKLVKRNNGAIYFPASNNDDTCFQPLKNARNHTERCLRFLISIASVQNVELRASDKKEIVEALKLMIPGHESLSVFKDILQGKNHNSELVSALQNYILGGPYGNLFDAEKDTLSISDWPQMTMIEMGELMKRGDNATIPALTYLIGQLDELFEDKKPTLLILDEAWLFMRHPVFKGFIETWLKTLRKYNVFVIMATQEVSDYDDIIGSVLTNCHTKILLPNIDAKTGPLAPLYKNIGLSDAAMSVISNGHTMQNQKHYFIMQEEGNAIVDFALSPEQLDYLR